MCKITHARLYRHLRLDGRHELKRLTRLLRSMVLSTWFCGILDPDEEGANIYGDETMSNYQYTIILHPDPDEGGYTVTVPALPGCVTQGETLEEAIAMAKDAIRLHVEALMSEGEPVPEEREHPQAIIINVAA